MRLTLAMVLGLAGALGANAESRWVKIYHASLAAVVAGSACDAASSWGKGELNPVLAANGTFGARSLALKAGISGAVLIPQALVRRHAAGAAKPLAVLNFAAAGVFGTVAAHNLGIARRLR